MMKTIMRFLKEEDGIGTVEMILIIRGSDFTGYHIQGPADGTCKRHFFTDYF